ncbi:hypothetical protein [Pseudomonas sp.]|uniref:hypothetical protein n=1 Tax=Pseudomonas sp. TaxID=306 RepID=UPI003D6E5173
MNIGLDIKTIKNFWLHIEHIQDNVLQALKSPSFAHTLSATGIPLLGKPRKNAEAITWLLTFCELLMKNSTSVSEFAKLFHKAELDTTTKIDDKKTVIDPTDEIFMEHLTAIWLALYFYGIPFCHPWEMVRRIAEDKGGLPAGACLTKAMGDVYRTERQSLYRSQRHQVPKQVDSVKVLVLTRFPSVIHPVSLSRSLEKYTPLPVHILGRCYAFLQLRLYINQKLPIRYLLPSTTLKESWELINKSGTERHMAISEIQAWLSTLNIDPQQNQRIELLTNDTLSQGVPTCILGRKNGVLTLGPTPGSASFGGNLLFKGFLESYRSRLNNIPMSAPEHLITANNLPELLARL